MTSAMTDYIHVSDGGEVSFIPGEMTDNRTTELGSGTCKNVHEPPRNTTFWPTPHFKCSECGASHVSMDYVYYCPNCGCKVVDEC